jgi:molybdate transport system substrate-binding protein
MRKYNKSRTFRSQPLVYFLLVFFGGLPQYSSGGEIHIAVASNFTDPIQTIANSFEQQTGHRVILSPGSSGKHYAQIINKAPFDVFFSADIMRAELLEKEGVIQPGTRFTYAIGKLVLWSPKKDFIGEEGEVLFSGKFHHISIANPRLAPYGRAAREVLQKLGLWEKIRSRIVQGENISQAYQFVKSGNAELGFVANSQVSHHERKIEGSIWEIPRKLYSPIEQQAVLLTDSDAARTFLDYVGSSEGQRIIRMYGYDLP